MHKVLSLFITIFTLILMSFTINAESTKVSHFLTHFKIDKNANLLIEEEIKFGFAEEFTPKKLYRDIPVQINYQFDFVRNLEITVHSVKRNGQQIKFEQGIENGNLRIYLDDVTPNINSNTYQIKYTVKNIIFHNKAFDELIWNIWDQNWPLPVEKFKVIIELPSLVKLNEKGMHDSVKIIADQNFKIDKTISSITLTSAQPIETINGTKLRVQWPKGYVYVATNLNQFKQFFLDNIWILASIIFIVCLIIYYTVIWYFVGRDPKKGTIIPLFHPPKYLSPAMIQYIADMSTKPSNAAFSAALLNMAVKRYIKIQTKDSRMGIEKIKETSDGLSIDEKVLFHWFFTKDSVFEFCHCESWFIMSVEREFGRAIKAELSDLYFKKNRRYFFIAMILSLIFIYFYSSIYTTLAVSINFLGWDELPIYAGLICFAAIFWIATPIGIYKFTLTWHKIRFNYNNLKKRKELVEELLSIVVAIVVFCLLPGLAFIMATYILLGKVGTLSLLMIIAIHILFFYLLKQPTVKGAKILNEIEGYKMYLKRVEPENIQETFDAEEASKIFEKNLPFAVALGLENEWCEKFSKKLERAKIKFLPTWYTTITGLSLERLGVVDFINDIRTLMPIGRWFKGKK